MSNAVLWVLVVLTLLNVGLLVAILLRAGKTTDDSSALIREELRQSREEARIAARDSREELAASLKASNETLSTSLASLSEIQRTQLDGMSKQIKDLSESNEKSLERVRTTMDARVK